MSRYKHGSIMRQVDDDPNPESDFEKGTVWVKAGDQSGGDSRTVISEEARGFVEVHSECLAVYGGHRGWLTEEEAVDLAIRRSKEEGLMESVEDVE